MGMTHADAFWFAKHHFRRDTLVAARKLVNNVRRELNKQMNDSNWLSNDAKIAVQEKLKKIKILIGFPWWHKNRTAVEYHYEGLTIGDDYVANVLSFRKYQKRTGIRVFAGRERQDGWTTSPLGTGAGYVFDVNIVNAPAGTFQPPFFSSKLPDYVHYAIVGMIVGHEMGHGFDNTRITTNVSGFHNMLNRDILAKYREQYSCIERQFSNYSGGDEWAFRKLDENIADVIGMQSALGAYQRLRLNERSSGEFKLPGFEKFSDEQMFFIAYGWGFCEVIAPGYEMPLHSEHSPPEFRVNSGVSNAPEFGRAFKCPLGSPMNPADKCSIWIQPITLPGSS
ncbi:endothelin-converting enzyme homolog [Diachasma alloeum]|uniref:endothelin-converting enzyme homolog n=1 Tax=Diachasma alloeum TaxID=454923 RepID=UPI0010FAFA24|nr:endothelin-converting enzyme homolog [Diachasma alloeum]